LYGCECDECLGVLNELKAGVFSLENVRIEAGCRLVDLEDERVIHWLDVYINYLENAGDLMRYDVRFSQVKTICDQETAHLRRGR